MKKVILVILVILLMGLTYYLFFSINTVNQQNNVNNPPKIYYQDLIQKCEHDSCCLSSVKIMESNNYLLTSAEGCKNGQKQSMLKCINSYKWCQPE